MGRGDIKIDYDTNDLIFKKSSGNVLNKAEFVYDSQENSATIKVEIPESESVNENWKSYEAYVDGLLDMSAAPISTFIDIEYYYSRLGGLRTSVSKFPLTYFLEKSVPSRITVEDFTDIQETNSQDGTSIKIQHYSAELHSILEIKTSAKSLFTLPEIYQPSNKSLKIKWGDGEEEVFTGNVSTQHTFVDGAVPHTITIEECDFTSITLLRLGSGGLSNGILSISLPRDLVSCTYLNIDYTEALVNFAIPETMVSLRQFWAIGSNLSEIFVPDSLINIEQIMLPTCANLASFKASRLWNNIQVIELSNTTIGVEDVNQILVELDNSPSTQIQGTGLSGASIPPPDSTSGDNDGVTAYWSLVDKGYSILISSPIPSRPANFPTPEVESGFDGKLRQNFSSAPTSVPTTATEIESFAFESVLLGDFIVENSVQQNEYILLGSGEGSFLQNPTYGVDLSNYIQSPNSDQDLINLIVDKFSQDALRVVNIEKNDGEISVESEDLNL